MENYVEQALGGLRAAEVEELVALAAARQDLDRHGQFVESHVAEANALLPEVTAAYDRCRDLMHKIEGADAASRAEMGLIAVTHLDGLWRTVDAICKYLVRLGEGAAIGPPSFEYTGTVKELTDRTSQLSERMQENHAAALEVEGLVRQSREMLAQVQRHTYLAAVGGEVACYIKWLADHLGLSPEEVARRASADPGDYERWLSSRPGLAGGLDGAPLKHRKPRWTDLHRIDGKGAEEAKVPNPYEVVRQEAPPVPPPSGHCGGKAEDNRRGDPPTASREARPNGGVTVGGEREGVGPGAADTPRGDGAGPQRRMSREELLRRIASMRGSPRRPGPSKPGSASLQRKTPRTKARPASQPEATSGSQPEIHGGKAAGDKPRRSPRPSREEPPAGDRGE